MSLQSRHQLADTIGKGTWEGRTGVAGSLVNRIVSLLLGCSSHPVHCDEDDPYLCDIGWDGILITR